MTNIINSCWPGRPSLPRKKLDRFTWIQYSWASFI